MRYVVVDPMLPGVAEIEDDGLHEFSERHHFSFAEQPAYETLSTSFADAVAAKGAQGVIVVVPKGLPSRWLLKEAGVALKRNQKVYFYWPIEGAIEVVDAIRLKSFWRHWMAFQLSHRIWKPVPSATVGSGHDAGLGGSPAFSEEALMLLRARLGNLSTNLAPVPFETLPTRARPLPGTGLYLRTDFWAPIISGGSYGHTCYQGKALAQTTEKFAFVLAHPFPLLDELGLRQIAVRPERVLGSEEALLQANEYYLAALRPLFDYVKPAYIFERACLGNFAVASLAHEMHIPYFVEYNGSEISMKRSFDTQPYHNEALFLQIEDIAFRQATAISVVSDAVKDDLVKRGIPAEKIIVNWNAVDIDAYRRPDDATREALRRELGFGPDDRVVCFCGTFGGWHGIDVLCASMPEIAKHNPKTKFLLIGDGHLKPKVKEAIEANGLGARVKDCGRVPQAEGARLLGAADIFVSPHSSHMVDSRFFGSPTKLFEYMAYGAGIVASDLEQIGEVMRPSIPAASLGNGRPAVTDERGIVCKPGDVGEFVKAVNALVDDPALSDALGANALKAARGEFTWDAHVAKFWEFVAALPRS
jgi:glycosyltransferase involved in cell wall biosynthesis